MDLNNNLSNDKTFSKHSLFILIKPQIDFFVEGINGFNSFMDRDSLWSDLVRVI